MSSLKEQTASGFFWKTIERFSSFGLSFVFSILIARILMPSDYGVVGMIGIFLAVSQTFIDSGFGTALVRKLDRTQTDCCTVFYFNIVVSCLLYGILWFCAPFIADFYSQPLLVPITRALSLNLILNSFSGIQSTKLAIDINFKASAKIALIAGACSGGVGYAMARVGFGVWAIVGQAITSTVVRGILLWIFIRWIPSLLFSWKSFKELFSFGSKLLASALLDTIWNNMYTIVIGRVFAARTLGLYSQAYGLASIPSQNATGVLQSVTFPVLARIQNEDERLSMAYRRLLCLSAFVVFPMMFGLAAVSEPLILTILGEKWSGTIPILRVVCFVMMWWPINSMNLNLLQVKGRSDYFLKLEVIKKIQAVVFLAVTLPLGIMAMCYGQVVSSMICLVYNTHYSRKLIGYGFFDQMRDLVPYILHSAIMAALAYGITLLFSSSLLGLVFGVVAGAAYYIAVARILRWDSMNEALDMMRRVFGSRLRNLRICRRAA